MLDVAAELTKSVSVAAAISTKPEVIRTALGADLEVIDSRLLYRAVDVALALPTLEWCLPSRKQLVELLEAERYFLIMSDRTVHQPISVRERKRLFRNLVCAWLGWFSRNTSISAVFFESTPHMGFDVVVFHIAKLMGVQTLILNRTLLENRVFLITDYRSRPGVSALGRAGLNSKEPIDDDWEALIDRSSPWSRASVAKNRAARGPKVSRLRRWLMRGIAPLLIAKAIFQRLRGRPRFAAPFIGNGRIHPLRQYYHNWKMRAHIATLREEYRMLCRTPDLSVPYIYFAAHYQPERTSQPEALEYEDQFLAIGTLSRALPPGWRIYVKEHPRQFAQSPPGGHRRHARTTLDYHELAAFPNVSLIEAHADSIELIRNARMCATLTGSTGWEALKEGKPALVFGPCWYCECEAVFLIDSVDTARMMVKAAEELTPADVRDRLHRFLESLRSRVFLGTTGGVFSSSTSHSYAELVSGLSDGICCALSAPKD
jgi:hypothetical protein